MTDRRPRTPAPCGFSRYTEFGQQLDWDEEEEAMVLSERGDKNLYILYCCFRCCSFFGLVWVECPRR